MRASSSLFHPCALADCSIDEELAAADAIDAACAAAPTGLLVLPGADTLGVSPLLLDHPATHGGFPHHHRAVDPDARSSNSVGAEEAARFEAAAHRYVAQGDMARILARAVAQGSASLALARGCLGKASYGQTFLPAVDWLDALVTDAEVRCRSSLGLMPRTYVDALVPPTL